jgi:2,3-bisphosphoglycerate-independent phosphoglycerate mutase
VVKVRVILDGASEPRRDGAPTSLERARTPVLDELATAGDLARLRTTPDGLPAGSEVAIPVLLGWIPAAPVGRGPIEAAARGIAVPAGAGVWRVDVVDGSRRADADGTRRAAQGLSAAAPAHAVHRLHGHRLLVVGPSPLPSAARVAPLVAWPDGEDIPRCLDGRTVVIAARGAAAGIAALMGAAVVVPDGATGGPDSDLEAKAASARDAIDRGFADVVVHVGGADEAAHARDARGKAAFLERADRELLAPLADAVRTAGGSLQVCADHGCDPATGRHDAEPVPSVTWPGTGGGRPRRLTERDVAAAPLIDLTRTAVAA